MKCPRCQQDNAVADARFCPRCGAPTEHAEERTTPGASYAELQLSLSEAVEQQTATREILRVISSSPTDYRPVFDTIVRRAAVVCGAVDAILWTVAGDELVVRAHHGPLPATIGARQPVHGSVAGYAVREARVVHVEDLTEADDFPVGKDIARRLGWRTTLSAPLLREGGAIGAILIRRSEVRPFSGKQIAFLQTFADQAVIAIENVRQFTELQEKNTALTEAHAQVTEALERQTATSEILRVISQSPRDVQPVFDTIVRNAVRLCGAAYGGVYRFDGELVHSVAHDGFTAEQLEHWRRLWPRPVTANTVVCQAIRTRGIVRVADIEAAADRQEISPEAAVNLRARGARSVVAVPMFRHPAIIGVIGLAHRDAGAFTNAHVDLLETFADQAVIAVENVRLFNETKEALERQTATSEILRVISSSPTDVQPVFDAIAESAVRLCDAMFGGIFQVDGDKLRAAGRHGPMAAHGLVMPINRGTVAGRTVLERRAVHVADLQAEVDEFPEGSAIAKELGHRTTLGIPLLREGVALGAVVVRRADVGPFADKQISLLETFADQAVIAIENVRLFTELQTSNRDLSKALDTQTATSDILRVISRSQTDVQPVFDAIMVSALRLLRGHSGGLTRVAGEQLVLAALTSTDPAADAAQRARYPQPVESSEDPHAISVRTRAALNIANMQDEARFSEAMRAAARARGFHSLVSVPLLREDEPLGAITITRRELGGFAADEIALLQTFADQAVIAIENTRLLGELRARTGELTRSVDELTALGEVSRALSSTLDLDRVLQTIVTRASQLAGANACSVFEYDEVSEVFHLRATNNLDDEVVALARQTPTRRGEGVQGRLVVTRAPVQVPDIAMEDAYHGPLRDILLRTGTRAVLAVPMLREQQLIGGLTVNKKTPGEFSPEVIELLTTFATQSALAIQNAGLFREIEQKSRELEAASRHKSEFLANMSHELRTPLNAIIGFSEVLSERMFGELNEKQDEYLKDIHASGQHLLSLINDILDLSKIEAGRMELELGDFDLPTAIDNALILVRERAARRNVALHTAVDERLGHVRGDERKIRQVLLNLLSNAIKFTPEGGRIAVDAKPANGCIEVSVTDTGVGIAPEDQEAVFEEFKQVGTAEKKVEGTGLGLALSRKFIELHGGKIWVKSQVGQGSTFTFTVPAHRGE
jgi:signal transduction histidine kinase